MKANVTCDMWGENQPAIAQGRAGQKHSAMMTRFGKYNRLKKELGCMGRVELYKHWAPPTLALLARAGEGAPRVLTRRSTRTAIGSLRSNCFDDEFRVVLNFQRTPFSGLRLFLSPLTTTQDEWERRRRMSAFDVPKLRASRVCACSMTCPQSHTVQMVACTSWNTHKRLSLRAGE